MYAIFTGPVGPDAPAVEAKDYVFAGIMCHINASDVDMQAEPGFIIILPQFQVRLLPMFRYTRNRLTSAEDSRSHACRWHAHSPDA